MSKDRINLVYIASIGRSGSTLLESMLGAHPLLATTGELHLWPHELGQEGVTRCGSGKFVTEDPFWIEMRRRVDPLLQPMPQLNLFREKHNAGRTLRWKHLSDFLIHPLDDATMRLVRQYGYNNYEVFEAFLKLVEENIGTKPHWVVDASKDPYRLLWLHRSGMFNIKVIHLVKDPRGFAYSVTKQWIDSPDRLRMIKRLYYTARQSAAWVVQNHLFDVIAKNHLSPADYLLLRYESLASDPEGSFRSVCRFIGCHYDEESVCDFRKGSPYSIAGNPMRHRSEGIYLDEKWKAYLPISGRFVADVVTRASRSRFGYA